MSTKNAATEPVGTGLFIVFGSKTLEEAGRVGVDPGTEETAEIKPRARSQACYSLMSRPHRRPRVPRRPEARPGLGTIAAVSAARGAGRETSFLFILAARAPRASGGGDAQADAPPTVPGPGRTQSAASQSAAGTPRPSRTRRRAALAGWREDASPSAAAPLGRLSPASAGLALPPSGGRLGVAAKHPGRTGWRRKDARARGGGEVIKGSGPAAGGSGRFAGAVLCCLGFGLPGGAFSGRFAGAGRADRAAPRRSAALGSVRSRSPRPAGPTWRRTWPST